MSDLNELDKAFSIHEQVCAERWKETILRIKRLETVLVGSAGAILLLLLGLVLKVH
tara:strand:- start:707 stop:874 length:168 start_codon:yes stop_codon:yes gene_type:complete